MDSPAIQPRSRATPGHSGGVLQIERGTCHAMYVYDVGHAIDLTHAQQRSATTAQRDPIKHQRKAPRYFEYQPPPLRITQAAESIAQGAFQTAPAVDCVLYDFGAMAVIYRIDISGPLSNLAALSEQLYESRSLQEDSRRRAEELLRQVEDAVSDPALSPLVEDYVIYEIERLSSGVMPAQLLESHGPQLAQILRSEQQELSDQEISDALSCRISFATDDITIIDWQAALVIDADAEDVRAVLEYANVELLEMRYLDDELDRVLRQSYTIMSKRGWRRWFSLHEGANELHRLAKLQMDSAVLFEEVNNALKLLGDQYLARVYRLASQRLHLGDWDASILRKLQTVESIYDKLSDFQSSRRMELLEWIIIILIALSTLLALLPGLTK